MHLDDDSATRRRPVTDSSVRSGPPRQFDSRPATRATGSRPPPHRTATSAPQFDHHHGNGVTTAPPEPRLSVPLSHKQPVTLQPHTDRPSDAQTAVQSRTAQATGFPLRSNGGRPVPAGSRSSRTVPESGTGITSGRTLFLGCRFQSSSLPREKISVHYGEP